MSHEQHTSQGANNLWPGLSPHICLVDVPSRSLTPQQWRAQRFVGHPNRQAVLLFMDRQDLAFRTHVHDWSEQDEDDLVEAYKERLKIAEEVLAHVPENRLPSLEHNAVRNAIITNSEDDQRARWNAATSRIEALMDKYHG